MEKASLASAVALLASVTLSIRQKQRIAKQSTLLQQGLAGVAVARNSIQFSGVAMKQLPMGIAPGGTGLVPARHSAH